MNEPLMLSARANRPFTLKDLWRDTARDTTTPDERPLNRQVLVSAGRQQQAGKEDYLIVLSWLCACIPSGEEEAGEDAENNLRILLREFRTIKRHYRPSSNWWLIEWPDANWQSADLMVVPARFPREETRSVAFFEPIIRLDRQGRIHSALDLLYDRIDHYLREARFSDVDSLLAHTDIASLSTSVIVGLLTATLPAKSKLPSRANLFKAAEALIRKRGEWEDNLLTGLEP